MKITEVRIFRKENVDKKLKAFATITFDDCFVVRDVKVIEGNKGLFVAMPSRRMKGSCHKCHHKNILRSKYCNNCGTGLSSVPSDMQDLDEESLRQNEHKDVAHPISLECREYIQRAVLDAFDREVSAYSQMPHDTEIELVRPSDME